MADNHVKVDDLSITPVSTSKAKDMLETVDNILKMAESVAKFMPGSKASDLVEKAKFFVDKARPIVESEWFDNILTLVLQIVSKTKDEQAKLMQALSA